MSDTRVSVNDNTAKNKRIASNTIVLTVRMILLLVANLYAIRIVVNALGEEDWGIFTSIAGIVTSLSFVSTVLALSTQRFFSIALGKNQVHLQKEIFSVSLNIMMIITAILFLVFETIGMWFMNTKMNIPIERQTCALWIFHFTLFTFVCSFIQVPFTAAIFAREDMGAYTVISTVECIGKVIAALVLGHFLIDNLLLYGGALLFVAVATLAMYVVVAKRRYEECQYVRVNNRSLYVKLMSFSGWSSFGCIASSTMTQGVILLLNVFFGSIVAGAFGIALQIVNAFNTLTNTLVLPFRPVMIKSYAEKNISYLVKIFNIQNKTICYFLLCISVPLITEMETILHFWLGEFSQEVLIFARLSIIYVCMLTLHNPITIIIHASGDIKLYHVFTECIMLGSLPISWILFRMGYPSYYVFFSMIGTCILAHMVRIFVLKKKFPVFSIWDYMLSVFVVPVFIMVVAISVSQILFHNFDAGIIRLIISLICVPLIVLSLALMVGLKKTERQALLNLVLEKCKKRNINE